MRLFKESRPLLVFCPFCNKVKKYDEWITPTMDEWCEMRERGSEFLEVECEQWDCTTGEAYLGFA